MEQRMEQGCYYGDETIGYGRHGMGGCFGGHLSFSH
jgi:hypothetical protein